MKKNQIAEGTIYLKVDFRDTFPSDWDDDDISEYIKKHLEEYVEEYELDYVSVLSTEIDNYGGDDLYEI